METINGMSPDLMLDSEGYNNSGGISLFSVNENGDTITGGSGNDGSHLTSARIYWTITRVDNGSEGYRYEGGITGVSWFFKNPNSPFYPADYDSEEEIWNIASRYGNLNIVFQEWNSDKSQAGEIKRSEFMTTIATHAYGCSTTSAG